MRLVKENLFVICTVAAVVVFGGVLLAMGRSAGGKIEGFVAERSDRSRNIASLMRSGVNKAIVEAATERVQGVNEAAAELGEYCLKRNRRDYAVIAFDVSGKKVNAFPIDPGVYARESLKLRFPQEYVGHLEALLKALNPTCPPGKPELDEEIKRLGGKEGSVPGEGYTRPPVGEGYTRPPAGTELDMRRRDYSEYYRGRGVGSPAGYPAPGATTTQPGQPTTQEATPEQKAARNLIWAKAQQGWIYASLASMDRVLDVTRAVDYGDRDLWMSQVGLWVQKDIVDAINKTNREAQTAAGGKEKGVPVSAVKRLDSILVMGYVVKRSSTAAPGGAAEAPGAMRGPPVASGGPSAQQAGLELVGGSLVGSRVPPATLTGRACNPLYDVVQYQFAVVMPSQHLRRLYENLRLLNFHTVLDVKIAPSGREPVAGGATDAKLGESGFYYGTDSVVQATITGELLLLTDWTRGRWDAKANAWDPNYPELMPVDFLRAIQAADPAALRPEDTRRVGSTAAAPAPAPAGPGRETTVRPAGRPVADDLTR